MNIIPLMKEFLTKRELSITEEQRKKLLQTYEFVKTFFDLAKNEKVMMGAHGLDHGLRVAGNAYIISQGEGVNPFLPVLASLLIDVGRSVDDPRSKNWQHGYVSIEIADPFLDKLNIPAVDKKIVLDTLRDHSRLNEYVENLTDVVKIVMDADRLATLGPLGPLRAAATRHQLPLVTPEFSDTKSEDDNIASVLQDVEFRQGEWFDMLWTNTGRKMGEKKYAFHQEYVKAVKEDVKPMYEACHEVGLPLDF